MSKKKKALFLSEIEKQIIIYNIRKANDKQIFEKIRYRKLLKKLSYDK